MNKIKKVYVITPIYLTYTERFNKGEYEAEIKVVKKEIERGARKWAYSVVLREGKSKVVETLN